jgi:PEP-CTERM motif
MIPLSNRYVFCIASAALLCLSSVKAAIISNPASIVDHGTYVSDTVNHRDWYKFSNFENTKGQSYKASLAQFAPQGWTGASLSQVQGLQAQFGWTVDTPNSFFNINYSLTYAMSDILGYTDVFYVTGSTVGALDVTTSIIAMTSETFFLSSSPNVARQQITLSSSKSSFDGRSQFPFNVGDNVNGDFALQAATVSELGVATWLTRTTPGIINNACTRVDPQPCPGTVPLPSSIVLIGLGLLGFIARRKSL